MTARVTSANAVPSHPVSPRPVPARPFPARAALRVAGAHAMGIRAAFLDPPPVRGLRFLSLLPWLAPSGAARSAAAQSGAASLYRSHAAATPAGSGRGDLRAMAAGIAAGAGRAVRGPFGRSDARLCSHRWREALAVAGSPLTRLAWLGMAGLALLLLALVPAHAADGGVAEPDDYRMENFKAPTPPTLKGARVVDTAAAEALWRQKGALFVDVLPRDVKPANLAPGTVWRDKPRDDIPGSVWLANVGYGVLNAEMDGYFRRSLEEITGGRREAPLLFYCLTDCWMSWNAARRALTYGYTAVIWYPAGSDGWAAAGLPLERATPRP